MVPILQKDFWPETQAITSYPQWLLIFGHVITTIKDRITTDFTIYRSLCNVCVYSVCKCVHPPVLTHPVCVSVYHTASCFFKLYFQRHHLLTHQFCRNISLNIWPSCKVWWNPPLFLLVVWTAVNHIVCPLPQQIGYVWKRLPALWLWSADQSWPRLQMLAFVKWTGTSQNRLISQRHT